MDYMSAALLSQLLRTSRSRAAPESADWGPGLVGWRPQRPPGESGAQAPVPRAARPAPDPHAGW